MKPNQVALVVNQDAAKVVTRIRGLRKYSRQHKLKLQFCDGSDLDYKLRTTIQDKRLKRLIVGGGDGTVSLAASLIRKLNPKLELAVLPLGTANYYVRSLGLKGRSMQRALDVAMGTQTTKRYLCRVNSRDFLIGLNLGTASRMFAQVTDEDKQRYGRLAYFRGVVKVLLRLKNHDVTIQANGKTHSYVSTELVVLNQHIDEPIKLVPEVHGSDPYFEIITYGLGNNKLSPLYGISMFVLTLGRSQKYLKRIQTSKAIIKSKKPQPVAVDGDSIERTPLHVELHPKPITFVCA